MEVNNDACQFIDFLERLKVDAVASWSQVDCGDLLSVITFCEANRLLDITY
jgi:hypothetical protein